MSLQYDPANTNIDGVVLGGVYVSIAALTLSVPPASVPANSTGFVSGIGRVHSNGRVWTKSTPRSVQRISDVLNFSKAPLIQAPTYAAIITAAASIAANKICRHSNGELMICVTGGAVPATQPTFSSTTQMTDGSLVWQALGIPSRLNTDGYEVPVVTVSTTITGLTAKPWWTNGGNGSSTPIFSSPSLPNFVNGAGGNSTQAWMTQVGGTFSQGMGTGLMGGMKIFEYQTDAPKFAVGIWNSAGSQIRVYVDDYLIEEDPSPYIAGNPCYYIVDFSTTNLRHMRRIRSEGAGADNWTGIAVDSQSIVVPVPSTRLKGVWIGDSFGSTISSFSSLTPSNSSELVMKGLGVAYTHNLSVGGIGYTQLGTNTIYAIPAMMAANPPTNWDADLVVFLAGYNDAGVASATIQAAALSAWLTARAQYPNAYIIVCGCMPGSSGPDANRLACEAALASEFLIWADPDSAYIPLSNAVANFSHISGTGKLGTTTGTGNSDFYTGADGIHPSYMGKAYLVNRLTSAINSALLAVGR